MQQLFWARINRTCRSDYVLDATSSTVTPLMSITTEHNASISRHDLNVCVSPPTKIRMLKSNIQDDGIRRWDLWVIKSWGQNLMNGISAFIKEALPLHSVRTQGEVRSLQPLLDHAGTLILDVHPPEPWEIHVWCLEATSLRHFVIAARTD